jgi:hypothetical protein
MKLHKCAISVSLAVAMFSSGNLSWGMPIADFSSTPLGLSQVIGPTLGTSTFSFDVDSTSIVGTYGYLNVLGEGSWLVQNAPLFLSSEISSQRNHVWFHDFDGVVQTSPLSISATINDQPFSSLPTPDSFWQSFSITPDSFFWGNADQAGETAEPAPIGVPTLPPPPPDAAKIEGFLRGGVSDLEQLRNECGPTSTANSLLWLAKKHNLTDKLPKKPDGSVDEERLVLDLAKVMKPGWTPNPVVNNDRGYPGLGRGELEAGKKKYMKDNKLPITVHGGVDDTKAQGKDTFEFVKKELLRGQDVEFLINWPGPGGGAHWVTAVGFIDAGLRNMLVVHDPLRGDGNHYWEIDDMGNLSSPVGTANRAVAESIPEPPIWVLLAIGSLSFIIVGRNFRKDAHRDFLQTGQRTCV